MIPLMNLASPPISIIDTRRALDAAPRRPLVDHPLFLAAIAMACAVVLKALDAGAVHAIVRAFAQMIGIR
jgi:hypothetical protein